MVVEVVFGVMRIRGLTTGGDVAVLWDLFVGPEGFGMGEFEGRGEGIWIEMRNKLPSSEFVEGLNMQ